MSLLPYNMFNYKIALLIIYAAEKNAPIDQYAKYKWEKISCLISSTSTRATSLLNREMRAKCS